MLDSFLVLVTIASIVDGILAGAGLDYVVKQLPARKIIGMATYRKYFLASDLANGRFWYIPLGIAAYVLNSIVAVFAYLQSANTLASILFSVAAACALIHAFSTSQAVPAGFRFRRIVTDDEAVLNRSFDKFARWVVVRGILGLPMFVAMLLGLVMIR